MQEFSDTFFSKILVQWVGADYAWILEVFVVVVVTLLAALLVRRVMVGLLKKAQNTKNIWDDALIHSVFRPAKWMILLIGLSLAGEIAAKQSDAQLLEWIPQIRKIGTIAIFAWFLVGFIRQIEHNLISDAFNHKPMDRTTATAIGKLLRVSVIITAFLVALQSLGYSVSGVLAFGGIGGIAVGFAAKDLLANFFGGLMVYLDRPFSVGDWIRSPDRNIEGTVEDIGWRLTRIRTFDKRPLYVPNSTFTQIAVENPSRMTNRRIKETIGIRYDDASLMSQIIEDVEKMINTHPDLDTNQTVIVNFNKFAPSSLDFFIYCFTKTTNWIAFHKIKQDVLLKIIAIIESHGAECAFPTSTLHLPEGVKIEQLTEA